MRKQDQNNIFKHKRKIPKFSKTPSPMNLKECSKLASKSNINDKHLNILNLQTYSVNDDSSLNEKYKIKSKEYKIKLQQTQDELYSRNNKIAQLNNQILYLQSQLLKQKQEISEHQNKIHEIQLQQPSVIIIEDSSNENGIKEIMANIFNLLSQMNSLVNKQKDFQYQQEYSKFAKEMHDSLIQVQQLFYKRNQESKLSLTNNEKEFNEAKLQLRNLQVINEELAQKMDSSQQQKNLTTSQYKESLLQMKDRVQNMRTKILQLEIKNQQETETLQKQLQQIQLEKQEQNDNIQKLKQSLYKKQIENKQLKEQMKLLQIKNEEFIKQIQKINSLKQIRNSQLRSLDLYNSTEVDLKGEISQLDDDIQKLQQDLQQALKEQSHIEENQQINVLIQMLDNINDFIIINQNFASKMAYNSASRAQKFILLFTKDHKQFNIRITVGLACDYDVETEKLYVPLYRFHDVYFPEDCYFNCDALPTVWMELFSSQPMEELSIYEKATQKQEFYKPHLSMKNLQLSLPKTSSASYMSPHASTSRLKHLTESKRIDAKLSESTQNKKVKERPKTAKPPIPTTKSQIEYYMDKKQSDIPLFIAKRPISAKQWNAGVQLDLHNEGEELLTSLTRFINQRSTSQKNYTAEAQQIEEQEKEIKEVKKKKKKKKLKRNGSIADKYQRQLKKQKYERNLFIIHNYAKKEWSNFQNNQKKFSTVKTVKNLREQKENQSLNLSITEKDKENLQNESLDKSLEDLNL